MIIKKKQPITLAEVLEILKNIETEKAKEIVAFIKKFVEIDAEKAKKLKQELIGLNIAHLKEEDIVKLIDFMPQDSADVHKILAGSEASLNKDEVEKVLAVFKKI